MTPTDIINAMGKKARQASYVMAKISAKQKNDLLAHLAQLLVEHQDEVTKANAQDVKKAQDLGRDQAFIDRLTLTPKVYSSMVEGVKQIMALEDPIGEVTDVRQRPSGIFVGHMRVPLGVIAMIYESRPNVTIDASALAIKSGNAMILRGGSEAILTNSTLMTLIAQALKSAGLPTDAVQFIDQPDRDLVGALIRARQFVDVLIPRGGKSLVARLNEEATVPMIKHLDGICHTYVDKDADVPMALKVTDNAKTQRYSPCNTTERF